MDITVHGAALRARGRGASPEPRLESAAGVVPLGEVHLPLFMVDDTHRDVYVTNMQKGIQFPISSMPGESVGHVYAGPMAAETVHFLECVATGRQPIVTPEHARMVMQVYQAADLSAETGQPVDVVVQAHPAEVPSLA